MLEPAHTKLVKQEILSQDNILGNVMETTDIAIPDSVSTNFGCKSNRQSQPQHVNPYQPDMCINRT